MLQFRKELFWDIDFELLNPEAHKRLIIERVLTLGNLDEFFLLLKTYDRKTLIDNITTIGYLDPKTTSFVINFFNIDKKSLKCYTKNRSTIQHWN